MLYMQNRSQIQVSGHWDDKVEGTGMTGEGGYWDDRRKEATGMTREGTSLTTVIPLLVSG
ncbi:hypothetical protein [Wolbachia endosymbiont (group A) of Lasioglossum fulvicorne]|uniref:hypothetical protein n=1 Tax=Wolbachia endosymbiont (group A) of Lasioglossum fulvicorne TaxID=3066201 RepID=UPI00333E26C1